MPTAQDWKPTVIDTRDEHAQFESLRHLTNGDTAVVVLRNLFPADYVADQAARIRKLLVDADTAQLLGAPLTDFLDETDSYHERADQAREALDRAGFDLQARAREALRESFGLSSVEVAVEDGEGAFGEAVLRARTPESASWLASHNIMREGDGTNIALTYLAYQLQCVVVADSAADGGELLVHDRAWEPGDDAHRTADGAGCAESVVEGAHTDRYAPRDGDVILFNPDWYHRITPVSTGELVTVEFSLGFRDDLLDYAVTWA
ncbi:2OG-Fe(II)-dependent halogenase WelO5 family protein [Streptomyces sp. BE230]|uniref:2OG-Fe(II)-dependent halogenase WelO5 family protein n=1 Tax=Streptomyces sp. BE230 TaxID=3002526 RepID=UPI002ED265B2|nr:hypothetical protein [Streptomyces sp. BE230]